MRKLRVGVLVLMAFAAHAALAAGPAGAAAGFAFHFDADAEGWEVSQGSSTGQPEYKSATWSGSAGSTGGGISVTDESATAFDSLVSPESIIGSNFGANLGGTLSMDVKSSKEWEEEISVGLVGGTQGQFFFCVFDEDVTPGPTYQTAHFTIDSAEVFLVNTTTSRCEGHPSEEEISEMLSSFVELIVPAEDSEGSGETTSIDDVTLSGGAPLPPKHKLTVLRSGTGSGTVSSSPGGILCGATCSAPFGAAVPVALTATPAPGSTFAGWSGSGCTGTGGCELTMTTDREVTAIFNLVPPPPPAPAPKPLKCKKGFKKKKVHGRFRCVKLKKKRHHRHHRR